ncbi:MAG: hypothetical protein PVSMB4_07070 [Ktedonobacterales bacterium]
MLGIATGAVLAMLFAPQPGDETRKQLAEQSVHLRRRGQDRYADLTGQFRERYGDALEQGRDAYTRAKDQILSQYNQAKNAE